MDLGLGAEETVTCSRQIVGIMLAKNEDRFARRAVLNALELCDRFILAEHASTDETSRIFAELAAQHPGKITHHVIQHPRESHALLRPYIGTNTWIFGVDGDEIYDPHGLRAFRPRLLGGEFDPHWMILSNVLNCDALDSATSQAQGYLAPPCRSITKLYNFSAIERWDGETPERLHGGQITFREGRDAEQKRNLFSELSWEDSPLRCLHTCFLRRSSVDKENAEARENIMELYCGSRWRGIRRKIQALFGGRLTSDWKTERYRRGARVTVETAAFFNEI